MKSRDLVYDTPIELTPHQTVAEALSLIPKRSHGAAVVVRDGRPVGIVSEADCAEVDRFAQVGDIMNTGLVTLPPDTEPRKAFDALDAARVPLATAVDADGTAGRGAEPHRRAARHALPARGRRHRRPAHRGRHRRQRRRRGQGRRAGRGRGGLPGRRHRPRPPGPDARRPARGPGHRPGRAGRRRQRRLRRGHPRAHRGGRRHRQGRRRPGRDVHHPDDDRRRPAAVLRGPRVRERPPTSSAGTSGPTGEYGTRATSRWRSPPVPRR